MEDTSARAIAGRLLAVLDARAASDEAVGVLRSWQRCGTGQARRMLDERGLARGEPAAVARVAAIVDADAHPGDDPDWD